MGIRFRRSVRLFPGVRVNFGLSGASFTLGRPGASVNIGRRATYLNTGIPGTGFSVRTKIGPGYQNAAYAPAQSGAPPAVTNSPTVASPSALSLISAYEWAWVGVIVMALAGFAWAFLISDSRSNAGGGLVREDRLPSVETPNVATPPSTSAIEPRTSLAQPEIKTSAISRDQIAQLQHGLVQLGFNPGAIDGIPGSQTVIAVKLYQMSHGAAATGEINPALLNQILAEARR